MMQLVVDQFQRYVPQLPCVTPSNPSPSPPPPPSGERVAAGRAGQHAAETAGLRAAGGTARGGQEATRVLQLHQEV